MTVGRSRVARSVLALAALLALLALLASPVAADEWDERAIEAGFVYAVAFPEPDGDTVLLVQGTSWLADGYYYVLTLSNLSPWPLADILVLDRYFPPDPDIELSQSWEIALLDPGQTASIALRYEEGPLSDACHQLEMSWGEGWSAVLMDCGETGTSTMWEIVTSEEMATYPSSEPLTLAEPGGRSKLGLHVTRNSDAAIMAFVEDAQPAVIVAVGDLGWLSDVKEVSPDTITIGRLEEVDQTLTGDPVERAREFVNGHAGQYLANPGVDYWLGWNEPGIDGPDQMAWYAQFESERVLAMAEIGLRAAIGNFSTGTPEADEFAAFVPAIMAAKNNQGILALHEYAAPSMREGVGHGIPGLDASLDAGALTLRYRYWYETYLRHNDLVIPLVITEAGIDGGVLTSLPGDYAGWETFAGEQPEGMQRITLDDYLVDLDWYDNELRRDPYVYGFAVFNVGNPEGEWASFDLTSELSSLTSIALSKGE